MSVCIYNMCVCVCVCVCINVTVMCVIFFLNSVSTWNLKKREIYKEKNKNNIKFLSIKHIK